MAMFRIYQHPMRGIEAVKVGFSWPGFFFTWIWMFTKQMWADGATWFGLQTALFLVMAAFQREPAVQASAVAAWLATRGAIRLVSGLYGN